MCVVVVIVAVRCCVVCVVLSVVCGSGVQGGPADVGVSARFRIL